jgi:glycosyltransferase involved in cell wall biosynthesis
VVLLDTKAHIDYFVETFGLPREKYHRLFVGADDVMFRPREDSRANGPFRVFYYATYLPLHGIEYIIRAAKKLERDTEIEFQLIGKGPLYKSVRDLARGMEVHNVQFIEWVPFAELAERIAHADICLGGHFSDVDKAKRVIAGKTFQFIAMKKPVIVGDCNANRELLTHKENSFFVKMADADALSDAILELRKDDILREQIAEGGYKTFVKKCNINAIAADIGIITKIVRSTAI